MLSILIKLTLQKCYWTKQNKSTTTTTTTQNLNIKTLAGAGN